VRTNKYATAGGQTKLGPLQTILASVAPILASSSSLQEDNGNFYAGLPALLLSTLLAPLTLLAAPASASVSADPLVEAEMLNDFHIIFDLMAFLGPAKSPVRLAAIIARIMSMAADYIPDHHILPEELAFQMFMLGFGTIGLARTALPSALALLSPSKDVSLRDRKVYTALFGPLGMNWNQYKALRDFALDWETVEPGQLIHDEHNDTIANNNQYIYWLYSGRVIVSSKGKVLFDKKANSTSFRQDIGKRLLGEDCLLHCVGTECSLEGNFEEAFPSTTAKAGPEGATLLRIHKRNLDVLMQITDEEFKEPMRKLLFRGFKDKLAARMAEA